MTAIRTKVTAEFANIAQYTPTTGELYGINLPGNVNPTSSNVGTFVVGTLLNQTNRELSTSIGNGNINTGNLIAAGNANIVIGEGTIKARAGANGYWLQTFGQDGNGAHQFYSSNGNANGDSTFAIVASNSRSIITASTANITFISNPTIGNTTGTTSLYAANAPTGVVTLTSGTTGQVLTSSGLNRTPYWKNGIYIAQNMTVDVNSLSVTRNTPINHTAPANLPAGWTYEAYTPVSGTNYWRNQTGRSYLVTVSGKVQVTVSGSPSNAEIDVWVSDVSLGNRSWQLACTGINSAQNIYAGPNNAAFHNINATLFIPTGSGFALWYWRNSGTLNVGGTPLGGFGTSSFLTVALQEI